MDKHQKRIYYIESLVIALIIFSVVSIIFTIYYEPFETVGIPDLDEMLIRMNRENIALFLFVNVAISFTGSILFVVIAESLIINLLPVIEAKAKLKIKECNLLARPGICSMPAIPVYKLRFELENGEEKVITVDPILYAAFFEGNVGILKYKERVFSKFIGFYIEEIN